MKRSGYFLGIFTCALLLATGCLPTSNGITPSGTTEATGGEPIGLSTSTPVPVATEMPASPTPVPGSAPSFAYSGNPGGCGSIFLYQGNAASSEYLTVWLQAFELEAGVETKRFDLATSEELIDIRINLFSDAISNLGEFPYCNDVGPMAEPEEVWQALSGTVTVTLSADPVADICANQPYEATVVLSDIVFSNGDSTATLPALTLADVGVGWCAG
ncbi:MAG: hypothetical protein KDE04_10025 [Anaerolineales bacterium]|nr:hypothetical protein [Anaerolineales bacterium]MCB8961420.1 hypothetical protein [Ardenticatenales bacterium]